ncbi:hypothetical protein AgCh_017399 [Apium graveolens]
MTLLAPVIFDIIYYILHYGIEISHDMFNGDNGISYEHFTHAFQNLALIIRENIFLNTSSDKLMRFPEIKLMYKLASHKLPHFQVSSTISDRSKRTILSLADFAELPVIDLDPIVSKTVTTPAPVVPSSQVNFEKEFAKLKEAYEELDAIFQSLQALFQKEVFNTKKVILLRI